MLAGGETYRVLMPFRSYATGEYSILVNILLLSTLVNILFTNDISEQSKFASLDRSVLKSQLKVQETRSA